MIFFRISLNTKFRYRKCLRYIIRSKNSGDLKEFAVPNNRKGAAKLGQNDFLYYFKIKIGKLLSTYF